MCADAAKPEIETASQLTELCYAVREMHGHALLAVVKHSRNINISKPKQDAEGRYNVVNSFANCWPLVLPTS